MILYVINFKVYLKNLETLVNPQFQYMIFERYLNLLLKRVNYTNFNI